MLGTTIYKRDSKNRIRVWSICVGEDTKGHYYEVTHGQQDGKLQTSRVYINSGKNIGKSNETTPQEQCRLEALALYKAQTERDGYSVKVPDTPPLKPMLAKSYKDNHDKVEFPCMVQPKLDGVCCLAHITKNGVRLISRQLKEFIGLDHISNELKKINKDEPIILHGELFSKSLSFQTITSLTRKTKNLTDESSKIEFWVYDMVSNKPYSQRFIDFSNLIEGLQSVIPTPTFSARSEKDIVNYHNKFVGLNYEGTMIRNINYPYDINKRSDNLLKYKDFIDQEYKIIGYKSGVGKFENVPTFEMVTSESKRFEAVPIGTQEQRLEYLKNAKNYLGTYATVRFFEYTEDKIPRFPVIVELDRQDFNV